MLKKIVLHTAATDNVGGFHDAGAELDVGEAAKAGVIDPAVARALIERGGAVSLSAETRNRAKPASEKARANKAPAKKAAAKAAPSAPTPPTAPAGDGQDSGTV